MESEAALEETTVARQRDIEYPNSPREMTAPPEAAVPAGTDLNRPKKQYKKEYPGDNPMAVQEERLWHNYQMMIRDVKD